MLHDFFVILNGNYAAIENKSLDLMLVKHAEMVILQDLKALKYGNFLASLIELRFIDEETHRMRLFGIFVLFLSLPSLELGHHLEI